MKRYLIDGNNVIGRDPALKKIQKKDGQASREKLSHRIDNFFASRGAKATVYFDGFENAPIRPGNVRIAYSKSRTADELIKKAVDKAKNRKLLVVVSSDRSVQNYARVNACEVIEADTFLKDMAADGAVEKEEEIIDGMKNNIDEFKKLFGVD